MFLFSFQQRGHSDIGWSKFLHCAATDEYAWSPPLMWIANSIIQVYEDIHFFHFQWKDKNKNTMVYQKI